MASTQIRVHQRVGGGTPPPDGADARLWRPQRRVRCVEAVQVGPLHEDSLDVEQESDREADAEPADEGRVDESHRCALAGRQRRQWKEARDGRLILCILRVLSRGEDLGDVERGVRQHEEASEECRARDGPVDERQPGGKREEVKGPPDRNLAKVVWVARVAPQARAKEAAAKLGAERLLGAQAAVLFRLEAHHLPVCRRLASEQQEVERRRRGVECVERHVRAGRRRRGRREGEEDELLEPALAAEALVKQRGGVRGGRRGTYGDAATRGSLARAARHPQMKSRLKTSQPRSKPGQVRISAQR